MSLRRLYESTIIVNAALEDQDIESVIQKVANYVENNGGNVKMINRWGRRRLAYPINKKFNGFYTRIEFEAPPSAVPVLERYLVLEDTVLRHLTLEIPEKLMEFRKTRINDEASIHFQLFGNPTTKPLSAESNPKKQEKQDDFVIREKSTTLKEVVGIVDEQVETSTAE